MSNNYISLFNESQTDTDIASIANLTVTNSLDVTGATVTGLTNVDLNGVLTCDTINEHTINNGVTVDGVLIKDGQVDGVDISAVIETSNPLKTTSTPTFAGLTSNGNITMSALSTVDGRDISQDGATLDSLNSTGLAGLTIAEVNQLKNIDLNTISNLQWSYLSAQNQYLTTTSNASFGVLFLAALNVNNQVSIINGNITLSGTIDGRYVSTDGASLDYLYTTLGLSGLTTAEVNQLKNIDSSTFSIPQWSRLAAIDQNLTTTSSPTFGNTTINGNITVSGNVDGVDVSAFKSDYDSKINQAVRTTSIPTFGGLNLTGDLTTVGAIDGIFIGANINQDVRTSASPGFMGLSVFGNIACSGNVDGIKISNVLNQDVRTTASPTFVNPTFTTPTATGLILGDGTVGTPSLRFTSDLDTGLYKPAASQLGISIDGAQSGYFDANGLTISNSLSTDKILTTGTGHQIIHLRGTGASTQQSYVLYENTNAARAWYAGLHSSDSGVFKWSYNAGFTTGDVLKISTTGALYKGGSAQNTTPDLGLTSSTWSNGYINTVLLSTSGTVSAPALTFNGNSTTGIYRIGSNNLGVTCNSTKVLDINTTRLQVTGNVTPAATTTHDLGGTSTLWRNIYGSNYYSGDGSVGTPAYNFNSNQTTGLYLIGANNIGISCNGTKQLDISATNITSTPNLKSPNIVLTDSHASNNFYTEGSWTPTIGDSLNRNFTLTTATGRYTRIGNMIHFSVLCVWSSKGSASGTIQISLPFAQNNSKWTRNCFSIGLTEGIAFTTQLVAYDGNASGQSYFVMGNQPSTSATTALTNTAYSSTGYLSVNGSYSS